MLESRFVCAIGSAPILLGQAATKKLRRMRQEISRLEWEVTGSELEALLLESRLVKQHQPRFNVLLREFIPLPYVRVDLEVAFPRLEATRSPGRDGATYFGPFRSRETLEAGVAALADALQLRDCAGPGALLAKARPCYRHEFGTCSAPCLQAVDEAAYRGAVDQACAVFDGRGAPVLAMLRERMERAAEQLRFETAARLRDAVRHIEAVAGRQQALLQARWASYPSSPPAPPAAPTVSASSCSAPVASSFRRTPPGGASGRRGAPRVGRPPRRRLARSRRVGLW